MTAMGDYSPINLAITKRSKDVIDLLVIRKVPLDKSVAEYLINDEKYKITELENRWKILDSKMQNVEKENASFLEWIISKGLDIDGKNNFGSSALDLAIEYNLQHIIPVLLKYTKKIKYINERNSKKTLLHSFLERNTFMRNCHSTRLTKNWYSKYSQRYSTSIVKILLDRGLSPDIPDKHGDTVLHVAIEQKENIDIIEMLFERSTNVNHKNSKGKTPFDKAIWEWKLSIDENNDYFMKILQALIGKGATDEYGAKPLFHVVEKQIIFAVEYLKKKGADFSDTTENGESLMHALVKGSSDYKLSEDIEQQLFDILINNGCQVNSKDKSGMTPLHIAANDENMTIVQKLLKHGIDVNCRNNRMETPLLYLATQSKKVDMAKYLLNNGANVNAKNIEGFTALHAVAISSKCEPYYVNIRMFECLLKYGADFNARTHAGYSVLHMGLWRNYILDERKKDKVALENIPKKITTCINDYFSREIEFLLEYYVKYNVLMGATKEERYKELINKNTLFKAHSKKYLQEIEEMKKTSIDSNTTLYKYLRMDSDGWRAYVKHEGLRKHLQSVEFKMKFPVYSDMIWACYRQGLTKKTLLEPAKQKWLKVTEINLPEDCLELIFSFFNNSDLFDFIEK